MARISSAAAAIAVIAAFATTARAQDFDTTVRTQELEAQLNASRQHEIALRNELMALEARLQADNSIRLLESERSPAISALLRDRELAPADPAPSYAAIPDSRLKDSNARVRAAARKPR